MLYCLKLNMAVDSMNEPLILLNWLMILIVIQHGYYTVYKLKANANRFTFSKIRLIYLVCFRVAFEHFLGNELFILLSVHVAYYLLLCNYPSFAVLNGMRFLYKNLKSSFLRYFTYICKAEK